MRRLLNPAPPPRTTLLAILLLVFVIGVIASINHLLPSLNLATQNALFRLRGGLAPPDDLVIVAIDDRSLQQIGPWPWPRRVMATVLDRLATVTPRAIGLDVIYAELSQPDDDHRLAAAIAACRCVVLPAQLYESSGQRISWLNPAALFLDGASSVGHVHVSPGLDGMVRTVQLSKADDQAQVHWAFALELVRRAEQLESEPLVEKNDALEFGPYRIPITPETRLAPRQGGLQEVRQNEMIINFAGATGTFRTISVVDLLNGQADLNALRDRIVLIGATAQSMGDSRVAPFMNFGNDLLQGGQQMNGVEIHANIINTIRSRIFLRAVPEWLAVLVSLLVMALAAAVILSLDGSRQMLLLALLLAMILLGSYLCFSQYRYLPPLVQMLAGYGIIVPMLVSRALAASRRLDLKLAALANRQFDLLPDAAASLPEPASLKPLRHLPRSFDSKLRTIDTLTTRILSRMSFVNRVLSSMGEGVVVTDRGGRIVFVNPRAADLLSLPADGLIGQPLVALLTQIGKIGAKVLREALQHSLAQLPAQVEFEFSAGGSRHCALSFTALLADDEDEPLVPTSPQEVIGIVVLIADISKRVELDRVKTETLQLVSHELRSPLNSIRGLSDVLLKFSVDPQQSRELVETINLEARRLGETINSYLDLTRIESGHRPMARVPVEAPSLIDAVLRRLAVSAAEKQMTLLTLIDPDLPLLELDPQLMDHALTNLISNAIKYSPPGTRVTIAARQVGGGAVLSVADQGDGIPVAERERVFQKFYRLARDASSETIGSGLGLSLVKEIVERHGGQVTIETATEGGTVFVINLPASVPSRHTQL
ncbi:MAG: CHASE2 domain-containing protein [Acidobacteriota bacterium]